jgi:hypothetical protein
LIPLDNIIFKSDIQKYFDEQILLKQGKNNYYNLESPIFKNINPEIINFVDDYLGDWKMFSFNNVKFKITQSNSHPHKWRFSPVAIDDDNKIINISNKTLSYFTILNYPSFDSDNINDSYNSLLNSDNFEIVNEDVFQFIDCFPLAPVHNLDDTYNLLYFLKKNNINCKLLVLKTDNFFYNQSLESLKNYFDLDFFYLNPNVNYFFKKFHCTRQYHWVLPEALEFIKNKYISKICEKYEGNIDYESVSIIKYENSLNASSNDIFKPSQEFNDFLSEKNIFDLNSIVNELEYKIYLINKSKYIITSFLSPFNVNIYKHCINPETKKILVFSDDKRSSLDLIDNHFELINDDNNFNTYRFYNVIINGYIISDVIDLESIIPKIELLYEK